MRSIALAGLIVGLSVLPCSAAVPAPAAGFSGRWELVAAHSEVAKGRKLPRGRVDTIVHAGPHVSVDSRSLRADGDSLALSFRYRTDGMATNKVMGQDIRTLGHREGEALVFESSAKVLLLELKVHERWTLPHADTLVMARITDSPMGKEQQRLVFARTR
jgi:hypothetical protein